MTYLIIYIILVFFCKTKLFSKQNYSTQEENLELIKKCLNEIKQNKTLASDTLTNQNIDYEQLVKAHPNFSGFIDKISFQNYINEYTIINQNASETTKQTDQSIFENMILINKISNVLTDPTIVDLITKKLLN
jgi:hypothetical protein